MVFHFKGDIFAAELINILSHSFGAFINFSLTIEPVSVHRTTTADKNRLRLRFLALPDTRRVMIRAKQLVVSI